MGEVDWVPFASRRYESCRNGRCYEVVVHRPEPVETERDGPWGCRVLIRYEAVILHDMVVLGVDAFQSLLLAFSSLGDVIRAKTGDRHLCYVASMEEGDLGIPLVRFLEDPVSTRT